MLNKISEEVGVKLGLLGVALPAAVYFLYFNSQGKVKRDQTPRVHQSRTSHPDVKQSERVGLLKPEAEVARLERGRVGKHITSE